MKITRKFKLLNDLSRIIPNQGWLSVPLDWLGGLRGFYVLNFRDGMLYFGKAKMHHFAPVIEILVKGAYSPEIAGFGIRKGDIVIDIGANTGVFSIYAARRGAEVYAFEPEEENHWILRVNDVLNKTHVLCIRKAVAAKVGTAEFNIGSKSGTYSLFTAFKHNTRKITVETTTLGAMMEEYGLDRIDFLKMDCEGAEFEILLNCPEPVMKKISRMAIEYHEFGDYKKEMILDKLRAEGFKVMDGGINDTPDTGYGRMGYIYAWRTIE